MEYGDFMKVPAEISAKGQASIVFIASELGSWLVRDFINEEISQCDPSPVVGTVFSETDARVDPRHDMESYLRDRLQGIAKRPLRHLVPKLQGIDTEYLERTLSRRPEFDAITWFLPFHSQAPDMRGLRVGIQPRTLIPMHSPCFLELESPADIISNY
jgi:hypothetical protein